MFIAVNRRTIQVTVSGCQRALNCVGHSIRGNVVGPECAKPDARHQCARVECVKWNIAQPSSVICQGHFSPDTRKLTLPLHVDGAPVKITRARPLVLSTPWRNLTFVVVETDEGLNGVGEVRIINNTDVFSAISPNPAPRHVIGKDPFDRELIVHTMRRNDYSRAGEVAMSGISLIEMACWDIMGMALNLLVYRLRAS
jgi:hypothetical protein